MAKLNQQRRLTLKYADSQGSASYSNLKEDADIDSIYNTAEAILSLQSGVTFERVGTQLTYELELV